MFYLYDNSEPESSYLEGEPCRVVCKSDRTVQCSSYSGECKGKPDRLICDGHTIMCPGSVPPRQPNPPDGLGAPDQPEQHCQS